MRKLWIRAALAACCAAAMACQGTEITSPQNAPANEALIAEYRDTLLSQAHAIDDYLDMLDSRPAVIRQAPEAVEFRRHLQEQRKELGAMVADPALSIVQASENTEEKPVAFTEIFLGGPKGPRVVATSRVSFPQFIAHKVSVEVDTDGRSSQFEVPHSSSPFPAFTWVTTIPLHEVNCQSRGAKVRAATNHYSGVWVPDLESQRGYTRSGSQAECSNPVRITCHSTSNENVERVAVSLRAPMPDPPQCDQNGGSGGNPDPDNPGAGSYVCFTTEHWVRVFTLYNGVVLGWYDQFIYAERKCYAVS